MAEGKQVELVLNGDVFDFDSVCRTPPNPSFRVSQLEMTYGLKTEERKSAYKIDVIMEDHKEFAQGLTEFLKNGHRLVFIIGNHDLELHWEEVQKSIRRHIDPEQAYENQIRFCEFFYISNEDTLIEHGHQYDPYCKASNPVFPFILRYNRVEIKIPFGNLATRYMINAMGFFNPYVESNYIMSAKEYVGFFLKYIIRAQPFLIFSWLYGASLVLFNSVRDEFATVFRDPLLVERKVAEIADKSNAKPRMVRELMNLSVPSAAKRPWLLARELWLDRAFIFLLGLLIVLQVILIVKQLTDISLFWAVIPILIFAPFFIFYSRTVQSQVGSFKEPQERLLSLAAMVTGTQRIVHGHTHIVRHEHIGPIEHLNSGTWSPAFKNVNCTIAEDQKTAIWIYRENPDEPRRAKVLQFKNMSLQKFFKAPKERPASNTKPVLESTK